MIELCFKTFRRVNVRHIDDKTLPTHNNVNLKLPQKVY